MLELLAQAAVFALSWPNVLYLVMGTMFGQMIGILPGLGGAIALALLLPVTYTMDPAQAMLVLGSAMGGVAFGGAMSAILFNAPGSPVNIATTFDGYPATQQGRAGEALGVAATASALGALFGVLCLLLLIPVMRSIVLALGPPEFLWLAVFGLTILAAVSGGSIINGLLAGAFGLLLSFHGSSILTGGYRFTFGSMYLWDGIPLVPSMIGLFAIAELINLALYKDSITNKAALRVGGMWAGVRFAVSKWWLLIRCSAIGVFIGAVPGVGATVSSFLAYSHARNTSKHPESFGQGNLEGIVATESNNDAKDGGALMPMLSLGIPGSPSTAVLLGGLMLHGLTPGKEMLIDNLDVTLVLVVALAFSNILTSVVGLGVASQLAKVTTLSTGGLVPVLLTFCLVGAYAVSNNAVDVVMAILFGLIGFAMLKTGFPRVPIVIGLVLGPLAEQSYYTSMLISKGSYAIFFTRPISLILLALTIAGFASPFIQRYRARKKAREEAAA